MFWQFLQTSPPAASSPSTPAFTVLNPGAEDGSTNWTFSSVRTSTSAAGISSARTGSNFFDHSFVTSSTSMEQTLTADSGSHTDIDTDRLDITVTWYQSAFADGNDPGRVFLNFLDASDVSLGTSASSYATPSTGGVWEQFTHETTIPSGTRSIVLRFEGRRDAGSSLNFYVDDISLSFTLQPPVTEMRAFSVEVFSLSGNRKNSVSARALNAYAVSGSRPNNQVARSLRTYVIVEP